MSATLERVQRLSAGGEVKVSDHGYDELAADVISISEVVAGASNAEVVEDYPEYAKGPCVLVLQRDQNGQPIHVLWGIPAGHDRPAVLITAYRPDSSRWLDDYKTRRT